MTTNIDRAAEILGVEQRRLGYPDGGLPYAAAQALADANPPLLMPNLPKPTDQYVPEWESPSNEHHAVSTNKSGTIRIWGPTSEYTPKESRDLALALLAAADCAEKNQVEKSQAER